MDNNSTENKTTENIQQKKQNSKKQSPIRFEAIIPALVIAVLLYFYSIVFFDTHLKSALEFAGYHGWGAEVNIGQIQTSFWKASIRIQNTELTNAEKPTHNAVSFQDIRFGMNWDALLRGKIVIDELAVEGVGVDSLRKSPGRVKPPPPINPEDDALSKALTESKQKALGMVASSNPDNVLGGLAKILNGEASQDDIINQLKEQMTTEKRVKEVELFLEKKQADWENRIQSLPQTQDFQKIEKEVAQIQTQNFKSPNEVQNSLNQFQNSMKKLDEYIKALQNAATDIDSDNKKIQFEIKSIELAVKNDLTQLKTFLKIPKIDSTEIMTSIVMGYIQPYLAKVGYYRNLAKEYMPPNIGKKDSPDEIEMALQPRPRAKGMSYEFGKVGGYPLFWLKKVSLSSQANASLGMGELSGKITDITSNQALIQRSTMLNFKGDFPSMKVQGLSFQGEFDNRSKDSRINYKLNIDQTSVGEQSLLDSNDIKIKMNPANSSFQSQGQLIGFKDLKLNFVKTIQQVQYQVEAKNQLAQSSLTNVFSGLNEFNFKADIEGQLPHLAYRFDSDFGRKLGDRLGQEVGLIFSRYSEQAEKDIRLKIENEKQKVMTQVKVFETQYKSKIDELKVQADKEKQKIEAQKLALEKQVKDQAQQKIKSEKNKIDNELNKAKDQLKKKFKL